MQKIDAQNIHYKELNFMIREGIAKGEKHFVITNVNGHRYTGDGIKGEDVVIELHGTGGNDLAAFMNGPTIRLYGNAQDGVANTMNAGEVFVHGDAGDVLSYGMRGGTAFIKGDVGYRVGIHMKEYLSFVPKVVIGGCAGDFFGEYMAGGILVLLGLNASESKPIVGDYCATGMHGGRMYIRGEVNEYRMGKEAKAFDLDDDDRALLNPLLEGFCNEFGYKREDIIKKKFCKLIPVSKRPYGRHYVPGWHLLTNRDILFPKSYEDQGLGYPRVRNIRNR
jgi:glutamate synthase domain-containing protein 3